MRIGVTDTLKPNLTYYTDWLKRADPSVEITVLSHLVRNIEAVDSIDGLMLTGGGDVDPKYYGLTDPLRRAREVSSSRDEFEFYVIERAIDRELPILGICRGLQVMNVYLGGTLILDLPSAGFGGHTPRESYDVCHSVDVEPGTLLSEICGKESCDVNSVHHQAIEKLGNGLTPAAIAADGVTEAAEWILRDRLPFLLLVQWHPERMDTTMHQTASGLLAKRFLDEARQQCEYKSSTNAQHLLEQ